MNRQTEQQWNIADIVAELRKLRTVARDNPDLPGSPPKPPSRKLLTRILDGLTAGLFPNRLGPAELTDEGIDHFVGHTLDVTLRDLYEQASRELRVLNHVEPGHERSVALKAQAIIREFAAQLPALRRLLDTDIQAAYEGDPAARSVDEVLICYPGIRATINHRFAHALYQLGLPLLARMIAEIAHADTGIDIHPGARIGASFFIDHGTGVVIGETAVIGDRVRLYQAVTLGAKRFPTDEHGNLIKGSDRHPIVEDDVVIYAGATILGRITIGHGSTIGGNVWLTRSVPPNSNITQAQVRNEVFSAGSGI